MMFGSILDLVPEHLEWPAAFSSLGVLAIVVIVAMQRLRRLSRAGVVWAEGASQPQRDISAGSEDDDDSHGEER